MSTSHDIRTQLLTECWEVGGYVPWAEARGLDAAEVQAFLSGKAEPSRELLRVLGYVRVVTYLRAAA
jgi:hypothetical protein